MKKRPIIWFLALVFTSPFLLFSQEKGQLTPEQEFEVIRDLYIHRIDRIVIGPSGKPFNYKEEAYAVITDKNVIEAIVDTYLERKPETIRTYFLIAPMSLVILDKEDFIIEAFELDLNAGSNSGNTRMVLRHSELKQSSVESIEVRLSSLGVRRGFPCKILEPIIADLK